MNNITIEIDAGKLKEKMETFAIETVVREYFNADDISYEDRAKVKSQRLAAVVAGVDWNKLPEEMQRGFLREFVDKFLLGGLRLRR